MKPPLPELLPGQAGKVRQVRSSKVLSVTLYKRLDSRFWQARVRFGSQMIRRSTQTENQAAAKDYAELAYRQFARQLKTTNTLTPPQKKPCR